MNQGIKQCERPEKMGFETPYYFIPFAGFVGHGCTSGFRTWGRFARIAIRIKGMKFGKEIRPWS